MLIVSIPPLTYIPDGDNAFATPEDTAASSEAAGSGWVQPAPEAAAGGWGAEPPAVPADAQGAARS